MAYSKQNFQNGQILNAANLEAMENGIIAGQGAHNLLDNSDFTNPVNQRGIANSATIERYTYFLDRWSTGNTAGTITLNSNGLIFNVLISQRIDPAILRTGMTVTAAAKFSDGTLVIVSDVVNLSTSWHWFKSPSVDGCQIGLVDGTSDGIPYVRIGNENGKTLVWAALYEGSYTADTLPPYVPKGKYVEMINCGVPLQPKNLLDNSDFTNPVNQRGQTSYAGETSKLTYTIDRWNTWNTYAKTEVTTSGLKITGINNMGYVSQFFEKPDKMIGKTYTLAAGMSDGKIICGTATVPSTTQSEEYYISAITSSDTTPGLRLQVAGDLSKVRFQLSVKSGKTCTVRWAALYEGSYDASTLPAYQPKGYAAELAECQRQYIIVRRYRPAVATFVDSTQSLMIFDVQLPQRMRIKPTAKIKKYPSYIRINGQQYSFTDVVISATYYNKDENTIGIVLKCSSNFGTFMTGHFDEIAIEFSSEV